MIYKSPARLLRSVKRITKFIEKKNESLTVSILPSLDIIPVVQTLGISQTFSVDILPLECIPPVPLPTADSPQLVETRDHDQQCLGQPELEQTQVPDDDDVLTQVQDDDDVLTQRRFFEIIEGFDSLKQFFQPP